jgi:hypothetical protein
VVVDNRPGASNTLAADLTAKSTDGHTMVMGVSTAHAIAPHGLLKLNYDNNKDLVPVVFVGSVPNVLVVNNSLPREQRAAELVTLAKKARQAELRLQRLRQHAAHRRRAVQGSHRHLHHPHPVQGQRPGAAGPGRARCR